MLYIVYLSSAYFFIITERSSPNSHQNLPFPLMANRTARRLHHPLLLFVRLCVLRRPGARDDRGDILNSPRRDSPHSSSLYYYSASSSSLLLFSPLRPSVLPSSPSRVFSSALAIRRVRRRDTRFVCSSRTRRRRLQIVSRIDFPRRHGRDTDRVQTMLRFRDVHVMVAPIHGRFFEQGVD